MLSNKLQELIKNKGIENIRFFVPMSPLNIYPFGICFKSSSDIEILTECYIDEARYKVSDGYKITLKACDERFGSEHYYQSDLESLIKAEHIYVKEDGEYIEGFWYPIPITENVNAMAFGTRIVKQSA